MIPSNPPDYLVLITLPLMDNEPKFREVKYKITEQKSGRARTET